MDRAALPPAPPPESSRVQRPTVTRPPITQPAPASGLDDLDLGDLLDAPRPSSRREPVSSRPRDIVPTPPTGTVVRIARHPAPPDVAAAAPPPGVPPPSSLEASLARLGVGVVEVDGSSRILCMNEAAEILLRRSVDGGAATLDEVLRTGSPPPGLADAPLEGAGDATAWVLRDGADPLAVRHEVVPRDGGGSMVLLREAQPGDVFAPTIARRARYDPLTGLFSRRGISERVQQLIDESRESLRLRDGERRHAVCYIDLDRFSLVNSTCGHDAGDDLLQWVATRLYEVMEDGSSAARIAGDEFVILLPDHDARDAERKARDVQRALTEFRFAWGHKTFLVETSLGVFPFGAEADGPDAVLSAASHACRVAKKNGGGRIQVYLDGDEEMAQSRRSMDWIAGVQHHLAGGKIQLYAQTIHPIRGRGGHSHFEVLMRVIDESGRPMSPVGIIEAAENGRMMDTIDRFVLRKSLQTIGALPRRALRRLELCSINLSAISLAREGLLDFIVEQLERSAVPPGKICFEITETTALNNLDEVRWLIQELGAMGCRFAIDDFGSGHASYGYLERLPVDYVKIDGLFVRDMMTNALHRAIVESVTRIATTLRIETIAECVETAEAAEVLAGMGVHYGQGWHYAKPAPIADVCKALDVD